MNYKYINRIYTLNQVGVDFSKEDKETLNKINNLKDILDNCKQLVSYYGNTYFYKDEIIYVEHSMQSKGLYFNKKIGGIYNKEIILFTINEIYNLKANKAIEYSNEDTLIYNTFKNLYL